MTSCNDRRVFLGMPGYGKQTAAAGRGFWRACADMSQVHNPYENGSLLAANFNSLWCKALNMVHRGERLDYFAMLHDDVGPQDFWLDELIDELEHKQLDVLGVVVPIKDDRGLTSIAIDNPGDTWRVRARMALHEVYDLPETFTADDIGHPLLLNTGCWVAKWNQEWCRQVHFEINDRIVFDRLTNSYQIQNESEDWYFSRLCNELNLKIGATRKIAVAHRGECDYLNTHPWGRLAFDSASIPHSLIPDGPIRDVKGWLTVVEGKALSDLARGKRVLEIGSYCGLSTIYLARTAEHVTAVDYFDGRATPQPEDTREKFEANVRRYGVADKVTPHHPDDPLEGEYGLALIDGAHDEDSVRADIRKALDVLATDGLIAFHDYHAGDPGVVAAVEELLADGAELLSTHDTLAVVRPPAAILLEV
jgi:SAM-dependent methyltransferase